MAGMGHLGAQAASQLGPGWRPVSSNVEAIPGGWKETAYLQGPVQYSAPVMSGWQQGPVMQMHGPQVTSWQAQGPPQPMMMPMQQGPPMMGGGHWSPGQGVQVAMMGGGGVTCDAFVEVSPQVQPMFDRGANGVFVMSLPPFNCMVSTSCNPLPPSHSGLTPFKPQECFTVQIPELQQVVFDPARDMPPMGTMSAKTVKHGAVLEVPAGTGLNAQIKTNSPNGTLVLEDIQTTGGYRQKVGETSLNYRLQVEGHLAMNKGGGNCGSDRLEVDLVFTWTCSVALNSNVGGMPPQQQY